MNFHAPDKFKLILLFRRKIFFPGLPIVGIPAVFNACKMLVRNIGMHQVEDAVFFFLFKRKNKGGINS